jgi:hypothetical protein
MFCTLIYFPASIVLSCIDFMFTDHLERNILYLDEMFLTDFFMFW